MVAGDVRVTLRIGAASANDVGPADEKIRRMPAQADKLRVVLATSRCKSDGVSPHFSRDRCRAG
jgi:hypothetical protein